MDILLALLAFSITMALLSTSVVAVVEMVNEVRGMRRRSLRYLIGATFDEVLWPQLKDAIPNTSAAHRNEMDWPDFSSGETAPGSHGVLLRMIESADRFAAASVLKRNISWAGWIAFALLIVGMILFDVVLIGMLLLCGAVYVIYKIDHLREPERLNLADIPENARDLREAVKLHARIQRLSRTVPGGPKIDEAGIAKARSALDALLASSDLRRDTVEAVYDRAAMRRRFVERITRISPSAVGGDRRSRAAYLKEVSTEEFISELARSEFGAAIRDKAEEKLDIVVGEIARRFEALGKGARSSFGDNAKIWSVAAAFAIAIVGNVDAVSVFGTYLRDPAIARAVDAQFGALADAQTTGQSGAGAAADPAPTAAAGGDDTGPGADAGALRADLAALRLQISEEIGAVAGLGVPIGWSHYPYCIGVPVSQLDEGCATALRLVDEALAASVANAGPGAQATRAAELRTTLATRPSSTSAPLSFSEFFAAYLAVSRSSDDGWWDTQRVRFLAARDAADLWIETRRSDGLISWVLGVMIGGALIGLGGPFWFDVYRKLSTIAQAGRRLGIGSSAQDSTDDAGNAPEPAARSRTIADTFRRALDAAEALKDR